MRLFSVLPLCDVFAMVVCFSLPHVFGEGMKWADVLVTRSFVFPATLSAAACLRWVHVARETTDEQQ